ncbi:MAG: aromatic ring-hydroxylating dioxygenase subunit alpha [Verrucomicrobiota bacterium]
MNRLLSGTPPMTTADLIARQPKGHSLLAPFYSDAQVYALDLERVWRKGWLFALHSCEIPNPGDYALLEVDADSIIVVRDEANQARAMHNVCRHRGSLVCGRATGHTKRLLCPYHQWSYSLDGSLVHAPGMQDGLDKASLGLRRVHVREVAGLIYVSLADEPPDFAAAAENLAAVAAPQGLAGAKVAKAVDYLVRANWKLVWENNRECYHCNANHPQYIKANFDHYNADDTNPRIREQMAVAVGRSESKWAKDGLAVSHKQTGMTTFPDAERNIWYAANRTVLVEGYLSETMDGKVVAPLMGDYPDPDVGTLRMRTLPNFWNHSSCDHAVSTRLLPVGAQLTAIRVWWLVAAHAVEGRDYDLGQLLPFWQLTSEQDWEICERQQRGVNSSAYRPGPYSTYKEYNVDAFVRWYLQQIHDL